MASYELKSQTSVTTRQAAGEPQPGSSVLDRDDAQLQRMGKKPVLKVRWDKSQLSLPLPPPVPSQSPQDERMRSREIQRERSNHQTKGNVFYQIKFG